MLRPAVSVIGKWQATSRWSPISLPNTEQGMCHAQMATNPRTRSTRGRHRLILAVEDRFLAFAQPCPIGDGGGFASRLELAVSAAERRRNVVQSRFSQPAPR